MRARGSVSVEFAAVLPLLGIAMLCVAQVGLVVAQQLAVAHAAREGARTAAIANDDAQARADALAAGDLDPGSATITIEPAVRAAGDLVTVTVSYRATIMPVVSRFVPSVITLSAHAAMRTERDAP